MFDPMTVAFEIKSPFKRRSKLFNEGYRPPVLTIWHKDPCKDGSDSSCLHHCERTPATDAEKAIGEVMYDGETMFDNRPHYPGSAEHKWFQRLKGAWREHRRRKTWCIPWRWHFWHWRFQFHPWQQLKRRWWDKCCVCGKRGFSGSAIGNWDGNRIWHSTCDKEFQKQPNP